MSCTFDGEHEHLRHGPLHRKQVVLGEDQQSDPMFAGIKNGGASCPAIIVGDLTAPSDESQKVGARVDCQNQGIGVEVIGVFGGRE